MHIFWLAQTLLYFDRVHNKDSIAFLGSKNSIAWLWDLTPFFRRPSVLLQKKRAGLNTFRHSLHPFSSRQSCYEDRSPAECHHPAATSETLCLRPRPQFPLPRKQLRRVPAFFKTYPMPPRAAKLSALVIQQIPHPRLDIGEAIICSV